MTTDATDLYPWIAESLPALETAFGRPKKLLGGGMFGQAFGMGDGTVVKVTMSHGEVAAATQAVKIRRQSQLLGLVYTETPVLLGEYANHLISMKHKSPLWAIQKIEVAPLKIEEIRSVNRANRLARHPATAARYRSKADLEEAVKNGDVDRGSTGTPFEFASEAAQDWVEATPAGKRKFLKEYLHWLDWIEEVPGFEEVAVSMRLYTHYSGVPLYDVRPENCGMTLDDRMVCYDFMEPEIRRQQFRLVSQRTKQKR